MLKSRFEPKHDIYGSRDSPMDPILEAINAPRVYIDRMGMHHYHHLHITLTHPFIHSFRFVVTWVVYVFPRNLNVLSVL